MKVQKTPSLAAEVSGGQAMRGLGRQAHRMHQLAELPAVRGRLAVAHVRHHMRQLVDQRWDKMLGVLAEQPRVQLDFSIVENRSPGGGSQPRIVDDANPAGELANPPAAGAAPSDGVKLFARGQRFTRLPYVIDAKHLRRNFAVFSAGRLAHHLSSANGW